MISYLGSLVQFSPAAGRAGCRRQMSLCVGSTNRVPATLGLPCTGVSVLSPSALLRLPAALYGAGSASVQFQFSGTPQKRRFGCACVLCLPRPERPRSQRLGRPLPGCGMPFPSEVSVLGSQKLGALSPGAARLFPPRPQRAPLVGSQEVFR